MCFVVNRDGQQILIYDKPRVVYDEGNSIAPYLNLIRAMFERLMNDLTIEFLQDVTQVKPKKKKAKYLQLARAKAYKFFFDKNSDLYADFLYWCSLTNFNPYFWRRKAIAAVALKIIQTPKFRERVVLKLCDEDTLADIDAMIMDIVRFNKQKWVM